MPLVNPGFEVEWDGSHHCFVFEDDGSYYETDVGNIFTPHGWITWFKHNASFAQPEVTDAWLAQDERRVHSGQKACHLFTFGKLHDAGLLQQVEVPQGATITFSIYAQAWSNHKDNLDDFPHPDDGRWSEGTLVGYGEVELSEDEIPPLNGSPQNDANGNISFSVGIDPTGGVDPYAGTVVWGDVLYSYNAHHRLPEVKAVAQSNIITVFVRSMTLWPFKHNDVYYDDAEFVVSDTPPTPPECPGEPRIDYERTYVLVSPEVEIESVEAMLDTAFQHRYTLGYSADDAGIGNLSTKRVIAIDPNGWNGDLREFFETYYNDPPVQYLPLEYTSEYQLLGRLLAYSYLINGFKLSRPTTYEEFVVTSEFGENRITYLHNGLDMRSSYTVWNDRVLSATNGKVIVSEHKDDGYGWRIRIETTAPDGRKLWLRYAHLYEKSPYDVGDTVKVGDIIGLPNSSGMSTADHLHIDVWDVETRSYVDPEILIDYWKDDGTPPPEPEPDESVRVGLHLQGGDAGIWPFYDATQSKVLKAFWLQAALDLQQHSTDSAFVFRHWVANQEPFVYATDKAKAARQFVDLFRDSLVDVAGKSKVPIYVCGLNEEVPTFNVDKLTNLLAFEMAFCDEVRRTHPNAYPACFTAAVGNPHESEFELCVPLARKCEETEGLFNYHAYWWANPNESGLSSWWQWHAGRWQEMDKVFVANGVHVKWFFGETGAVGSDNGNFLLPDSGWKSSDCYAGNWLRYEIDILEFQRRIREWNSTHNDRAVGGVLFTTSGPGWDNFNIGTTEMEKLALVL